MTNWKYKVNDILNITELGISHYYSAEKLRDKKLIIHGFSEPIHAFDFKPEYILYILDDGNEEEFYILEEYLVYDKQFLRERKLERIIK